MAYNSIVLVREIWDTRDLLDGVVRSDGQADTSRLTTRFDPEDLNALEMALQVKDEHGGTVTALSVGASREVDVLRESLYRGVDAVYRVVDPVLDTADTSVKATAATKAVEKIGRPDLFIAGLNVGEGENSHVGVHTAQLLGLPRAHYVDRLQSIGDGAATCIRAIEGGYETVAISLPAALIVGVALLKEDPRAPRSAKARLKLQMKKTPIEQWSIADLGLDPATIGNVTICVGVEPVEQRAIDSRRIEGSDEAALKQMIQELKEW
ncbi:MAG: hypothetical protein AUJ92_20385 [Armatimonadetes bacterium CG2_30_59_28]|nr:electron transfer flavoprotein subunit beta/FixA family protein [Armatimonadota bacterium]OIO89842.1 MAG: hypothetical protein AUJ92_20385 [Armatimonadetes bacterium CG2_30_59_28]PIU64202.1 MAG: hypothetical protein COS85_13525 [Armatimonadetes bacterium CG07_land_8_20_14_0_80_59_28]PIX40875.1 MAG: hypothetical protein COZ56_13550 [Armatimonadetes bacterium CG_4_8_14_3_um_filter_58_9]PIY43934.1 MAG: hypothetical protein COZ05_09625 [Armatimonadetes bacterium CG_4_10_14_3_um_filter_59_10]PJB